MFMTIWPINQPQRIGMVLFVFENVYIYTCFINIYTFFSDLLCLKFINLMEMDQNHLYSTVWSHQFMNSLVMVLRFSIYLLLQTRLQKSCYVSTSLFLKNWFCWKLINFFLFKWSFIYLSLHISLLSVFIGLALLDFFSDLHFLNIVLLFPPHVVFIPFIFSREFNFSLIYLVLVPQVLGNANSSFESLLDSLFFAFCDFWSTTKFSFYFFLWE